MIVVIRAIVSVVLLINIPIIFNNIRVMLMATAVKQYLRSCLFALYKLTYNALIIITAGKLANKMAIIFKEGIYFPINVLTINSNIKYDPLARTPTINKYFLKIITSSWSCLLAKYG
jgi:hypothetical protein